MAQARTTMQSLRQELLRAMPELDLLKKRPTQLLSGLILVAAALTLHGTILNGLNGRLSAFLLAALGVILGIVYGLGGIYAHALLHGSILSMRKPVPRAVVRVAAWFGFLIFGCSPELWLTWHNRIHHFHTNEPGVDPDSFGLWSEFQKLPMSDFVLKRAPGTRHWLSWVYLPFNFNNQALTVMWYFLWKGDPKLFQPVDKRIAVAETLTMYFFWTAFIWKFGAGAALWAFLIPLCVANLVVSSFILVQHLFCPLNEENDPLEHTMGVTLPAWLDRATFYFGHHVEHHTFPEINHVEYPALRAELRRRYPQRYRLMPFGEALRALMITPRVYLDESKLLDPATGTTVDVRDVGRLSARTDLAPSKPARLWSGAPEPRDLHS